MTRINLVDPSLLTDQHLIAEWRETKMVPPALLRSLRSKTIKEIFSKISKDYTLNTGHVMFFYPRMRFLKERYEQLTLELIDRGVNLNNLDSFDVFLKDVPKECCEMDWSPKHHEVLINIDRIHKRILEKPTWYKYRGKLVPKDLYESFGYTIDY